MLPPRSLLPRWELGSGSEVMPSWCKGLSCLTRALWVSPSGLLWCCRAMDGSLNGNRSRAAVTAPGRAVLPPLQTHKTPGGVAGGSLPLAVETAAPGAARRWGDAVPAPPAAAHASHFLPVHSGRGEGRGGEGRAGRPAGPAPARSSAAALRGGSGPAGGRAPHPGPAAGAPDKAVPGPDGTGRDGQGPGGPWRAPCSRSRS